MEGTKVVKLILGICKTLVDKLNVHRVVEGDCVHSLEFLNEKRKITT